MPEMSRRALFALPAAAALVNILPPLAERAVAGAPAIRKPLPARRFIDFGSNAEMRWESVNPKAYYTSQAHLYVRNHTSTPTIDHQTYRLRIFGDGLKHPKGVSLSLHQIKSFPHVDLTTVHECTGNGRAFFKTQQSHEAAGTQWTLGAVGTVRWTGVRLRDVLASVGLRHDAVSVMSSGLDPHYVSGGTDYGPVRRPFPIEKANHDVLLVFAANGEPLLPDHGYPLRLVVPGWIGVASTKWLGSLEVSTSEQTSPWNTTWYTIDGKPLTHNPVRSAFELPWDAQLPAAKEITVKGRSWSGRAPIAKVEISCDGGTTWERARLHEHQARAAVRHGDRPDDGFGWTQWSYTLHRPAKGAHILMARATDEAGRRQPMVAAYNPNGYFFDAVVKHPVTVV